MMVQVKEYLFRAVLLELVLLPSLVVSRNPEQRPVNEAAVASPSPFDLAARLEKTGLMISSWSLIAQPGKRNVLDYSGVKRRQRRRPKAAAGMAAFPILRQQSTNAAAEKRDLHNKEARDAMIVGEEADMLVKRLYGYFLPGQINSLSSDETKKYNTASISAFQAPKIVYKGEPLPAPFVHPINRGRGRVFGLANFLIRDRPPTEPKSFSSEEVGTIQPTKDIEHPLSDLTSAAEDTTTIVDNEFDEDIPARVINTSNSSTQRGADHLYALYHQIFNEKLDATTMRNSEDHSLVQEEFEYAEEATSTTSVKEFKFDYDYYGDQDYDSSEIKVQKVADSLQENENVKEVSNDFKISTVEDATDNVQIIIDKDEMENSNRANNQDNTRENTEISKQHYSENYSKDHRQERQNVDIVDATDVMDEGTKREGLVYEFDYRVIDHASGNDFGHYESRRGAETNGRYHALLPNGRVQRVVYTAGQRGYRAAVTFEADKRETNDQPEHR